MATTTPNYGLTKPDLSELYDIGVQNTNMDLIDAALNQQNINYTALETDLYYHKGDAIKLYRTPKIGYITSNTLNFYISIPLSKPVSSDVTGASITGRIVIRGVNGYVGGSTGFDLSDTTVVDSISVQGSFNNANQGENDVTLIISVKSALSGSVNNTPVAVGFDNSSRLTFS